MPSKHSEILRLGCGGGVCVRRGKLSRRVEIMNYDSERNNRIMIRALFLNTRTFEQIGHYITTNTTSTSMSYFLFLFMVSHNV